MNAGSAEASLAGAAAHLRAARESVEEVDWRLRAVWPAKWESPAAAAMADCVVRLSGRAAMLLSRSDLAMIDLNQAAAAVQTLAAGSAGTAGHGL
ncbi:MAG: hypothetical protein FWD29_05745 [Micrococcales bacterium]|nr:hypothetical protein [Micrococcales bacterium]